MAAPTQRGTAVTRRAAPTFTDFIVLASTWRERGFANSEETENEDGEVINVTFSDPGVDAECEWVIKTTGTAAEKGDVVTDGTSRKFLVVDVEDFNYGGRVARQRVSLMYRAKLGTLLTT